MYLYICEKCGSKQYSASSEKENEKCLYCDSEKVIFSGVEESR